MCGLCGLAGTGIQTKDLEAFSDLLWVTSLRGHHSTGVFSYAPSKVKKYNLQKELGPSPLFILRDEAKKIPDSQLDSVLTELLMGHCRYATKGHVTRDNAHPFDTGRYVSAHNGTLVDSKYDHKSKTDSQLLFEDIERRGIEKVIKGLDYNSAYALSIFDKQTETLTLGTNGDRPLYGAYNTERSVLYWASELSALQFIATRRKLKVNFIEFEDDKFYSVSIKDISKSGEFWDIVEYPKKAPPPSKKWDWDKMGWSDAKKLEAFCCCCGTLLYGKAKHEAYSIEFDGEMYWTCADCIGPASPDCIDPLAGMKESDKF